MTNSNNNDGPLAAALAAATSTSKLSNYTMGKYVESESGMGHWYIIAVRKPKADWSGLDITEKEETYVPKQKRRLNSKSEVTEY